MSNRLPFQWRQGSSMLNMENMRRLHLNGSAARQRNSNLSPALIGTTTMSSIRKKREKSLGKDRQSSDNSRDYLHTYKQSSKNVPLSSLNFLKMATHEMTSDTRNNEQLTDDQTQATDHTSIV